jgi:N5-(carboxyethyl)ornithine synthase
MEIETSHATTLEDPVYYVDGIAHYVADHTPTIAWKTASGYISSAVKSYFDALVESRSDSVLEAATVIRDGVIIDERISRFQHRA